MSDGRKTILMIAGEASGDTLGAELIDAIRRRDPESAVACMNTHLLLAQQDLVVSPGDTETRRAME